MIKKPIFCALIGLITVFNTGCWDNMELGDRAYIYMIAIDMADEHLQSNQAEQSTEKKDNIRALYFSPKPSELVSSKESKDTKEAGEKKDKAFIVFEENGTDLYEMSQRLENDCGRVPFYGQMKNILIGEKLLNNSKAFKELLDYLEKDPELNRLVDIITLKGDINNIQNIDTRYERVPANYIFNLFKTAATRSDVYSYKQNELFMDIRPTKGMAIIPCFEVRDNGSDLGGLTLINNYQKVSELEPGYITPYSSLVNKLKKGVLLTIYKDAQIPYSITSNETRILFYGEGEENKLKYKIKIRLEGDLIGSNSSELKEDDIDIIKNQLIVSYKNETEKVIDFFQKDLKLDYLEIGDYTHKYQPKVFEKYKNNWNKTFSDAELDTEIELYIRRIGTAK